MEAPPALQPALFDPHDPSARPSPGSAAPVSGPAGGETSRSARPRRAVPPPLALCVLGSGSGGNCSVLRHHDGHAARHLLIDAGFGPRTTALRLAQVGLTLGDLAGVCVTHFDADHFRRSWCRTLVALNVPLYCHHWHLADLRRLKHGQSLFDAGLVEAFDAEPFTPLPGLTATTLRLQHDRQGTIAYRFDTTPPAFTLKFGRGLVDRGPRMDPSTSPSATAGAGATASRGAGATPSKTRGMALGYATDLGHAPAPLLLHMAGVDLLAIESNYDEHMTRTCARPAFVNRRNLSDSGHLSNDQALAAVRGIADLSPHGNPRRVVLLHRSDQCNHPTKVARCFAQDPALARRVAQTQPRRRSRWFTAPPLHAVRRCQLTLAAAG